MSHTGNWHRSPRKMALETARQRERERAAAAEATREIVFEMDQCLARSHPCHAHDRNWNVTATCTCGRVRWLDLKPLLSTHLAHAPWPRVMRSLTCEGCKGQPIELGFDTEPRGLDQRRVRFAHVRARRG